MKLPPSIPEQIIKQYFERYFHHLVLAALRYVNEHEKAEDIVQDVFVKVWQNIEEIKDIEDVKGYLFKAVKNSCLNYLRYQKVRQNAFIISGDEPSTFEKSAEETKIDEETNQRIHAAIANLPDHWREVFVMSKYNQMKYHEIANELNISQKTVEKYISKSLHLLRDQLKDLLILLILLLKSVALNYFVLTVG